MKKFFSKELTIGLCVVLALLILFFGIDYLKGINVFKASNYYYVSYTNVNGLAVSSPVTASGFKVGLVREIRYEYDNPGHVLVEISLDKALKIPSHQGRIVTDLLGTATISLKMPDTTTYHNVGDRLEGVVATGMMDNVATEVLPSVTAMMPKIDSLLTAITTLVSDPALLNSIRRMDKITANLESATSQLSASMKPLPSVMNNADEVAHNLAVISDDLKVLSAELKTMPSGLDNAQCTPYHRSSQLDGRQTPERRILARAAHERSRSLQQHQLGGRKPRFTAYRCQKESQTLHFH